MRRAAPRAPRITIEIAKDSDVAELVEMRNAVAEHLTAEFGGGHWSTHCSERGVRHSMKHAKVLVARQGGSLVGTLRLAQKKPWAIDVKYFAPVPRPLYLLDMAVTPLKQRRGLGRKLLDAAVNTARAWPAQAIRLDAYDDDAGAGEFYAKCGYAEVGRVVYRAVPLRYYELVLADAAPRPATHGPR